MPAERGRSTPPPVFDPRELTVRTDTAGGPGGQHANRTKSRVTVELDLRTATSIDEATRERLRSVFGDVVRSTSSVSRRQGENRRLAEERLARRLAAALEVRTPRRRTAPTKSAVERRLESKRRRSSVKRLRTDLEE
ncbi:MAG TPA: peptide chain release factor-like protein [Acidimicrobiales bacterium]|nr:peptide chain release factor-like protein [Acidimicrobiales bacterium]